MNFRSIRFRLTAWYGGFLFLAFVVFGIFVYLSLKERLEATLVKSHSLRAQQICETLLSHIHETGEQFVLDKIKFGSAPELNDRFLRITRPDGTLLYLSGVPRTRNFNPEKIPFIKIEKPPKSQRIEDLGEEHLFIITKAYQPNGGPAYWIETGSSTRSMDETLEELLYSLLISLPFFLGLAIAGGYFLVDWTLRPVDTLIRSAEKITLHQLSQRVTIQNTGDELERLGLSFNRMIERLDESFQHASRFSADASHELRTPLTVMRCELDALISDPTLTAKTQEKVGSLLEEVDYLTKIVEGLFAISRLESGEIQLERSHFDFSELVSATAEQMLLLAEEKHLTLNCHCAASVFVSGDRVRLKQVVVNLLDNAIKFTPSGGTIQLRVYRIKDTAFLDVSDTGIGIPQQLLKQVFERFFCVDVSHAREKGGSGLGLSIVRSICNAHGGKIEVHSTPGEGSRFLVQLSATSGDAAT